jgi:hypothetical protein
MNGTTAVLLALGPAIVTGVVGYRGAMLQAAVSIKGVEAENERLRQEQREGERQRRLGSYHDFLSLMHRLDAMMAGFAPLSKEAFDGWLDAFQSLYGGIDLYGSDSVREQLAKAKDVLDEIGTEARRERGGESFERRFAAAYPAGRRRLIEAVGLVLEEMRRDVFMA